MSATYEIRHRARYQLTIDDGVREHRQRVSVPEYRRAGLVLRPRWQTFRGLSEEQLAVLRADSKVEIRKVTR